MPGTEDGQDDAYDHVTRGYAAVGERLAFALRTECESAGVVLHQVPYRVKAQDSADRKLIALGLDSYTDLHDLLGLRVITLFESELDLAETVIRRVLDVDDARSSDKRARYEHNQFGYRSRHFVGAVGSARGDLLEFAVLRGRVVEVQLRSILQHAWAEIEHDLGYKPSRPLSPTLRRRFAQLAATTELIDEQYSALRQEAARLEDETKSGTAAEDPDELTLANMARFIEKSRDLNIIDRMVADALGENLLTRTAASRAWVGYVLDRALSSGWTSISEIAVEVAVADPELANRLARSVTPEEARALHFDSAVVRPGITIVLAALRRNHES